MAAEDTREKIMFFLGAGASVEAGVPNTFGLVDRFKESLSSDKEKTRTLESVLSVLKKWVEESDKLIDVELLLETLEKLANKESEIILRFCKDSELRLPTDQIASLIADLKKFIRSVMVVKEDKIKYLEPLISFINDYHELDVFSLNYDTCIEQVCSVYHKSFVDGFDLYWNPAVFEKDVDLKLYKLHGSIMWYRTDRGNYVKILVQDAADELKLVTGEKAKNLILYPMRKMDYAEPLLELLLILKEKLSKMQFVFVVGYSFRDDHIRQVFWDAASRNRNLVMILISPSAHKIYEERLRFREEGGIKIPSSLENRVLPLSYPFGKVFPRLLTHYLAQLRQALVNENACRNNYFKGYSAPWKETLAQFIECEYMSKANEIIQKYQAWENLALEDNDIDIRYGMVNSFKATINSLQIGDIHNAKIWIARFHACIKRITAELTLEPNGNSDSLAFTGHIAGWSVMPSNIKSILNVIISWSHSKLSILNDNSQITDEVNKLLVFQDYLTGLEESRSTYQQYMQTRKDMYKDEMAQLKVDYLTFRQADAAFQDELRRKIRTLIRRIEQNEIEKILR